jgi:hypothetical protein
MPVLPQQSSVLPIQREVNEKTKEKELPVAYGTLPSDLE